MSSPDVDPEDDQDSTIDDQFRALLAGVRTTLPGASILLSFLLAFPLQAGFGDLNQPREIIYSIAVLSTALATLLLIAPSAQARARLPKSGLRRHTPSHVMTGAYCALAGTAMLLVAIVVSLTLILSIVYSPIITAALVLAVAVVGFGVWFGFPIWWSRKEAAEADH